MGLAYASRGYLESLAEFGEPLWLPEAGGGLLVQPVPGTGLRDARGAYPLLACENWERFSFKDLSNSLVSVVALPDPLTCPGPSVLEGHFPHLCRPYKEHFWVDLRAGPPLPCASHRRKLRKAAQEVEVEVVEEPLDALEDWSLLYDELIRRHEISGIARFSRSSFEIQLALDGMIAMRAWSGGAPVAMTLWLVAGDKAYYHLGASTSQGYALGASYALFDVALRKLSSLSVERVLLGSGAGVNSSSDGLARFKAGWATGTKTACLCGRIVDRPAYERLSARTRTSYFPAYRDSANTAQAMTSCSA